jgi:ABC-type glycerol-3-phosphate transport system permease component
MRRIAGWVLSVLVAFLFLLPLIWMVRASFMDDAEIFSRGTRHLLALRGWTLQNYADAWRRSGIAHGLVNSTIQASGIVLGGLLVNSLAAFAFARMAFRGRDVLFAAVVVLIILPVEVLVVPLFFTIRDMNLIGGRVETLLALTLPFTAKAFNIYFLRQHFLALPAELEEAAIVDGAGPLRIYWHIALPAIRPALATVVILDVLTHWSDFIWPLVVSTRAETRTVQLSLANLFTQPPVQWGDILACAVIATLPVLLLFRVAQRYIVLGHLQSGIK